MKREGKNTKEDSVPTKVTGKVQLVLLMDSWFLTVMVTLLPVCCLFSF